MKVSLVKHPGCIVPGHFAVFFNFFFQLKEGVFPSVFSEYIFPNILQKYFLVLFISSCIASYNPLYIALYIPAYIRITDKMDVVGDVFKVLSCLTAFLMV